MRAAASVAREVRGDLEAREAFRERTATRAIWDPPGPNGATTLTQVPAWTPLSGLGPAGVGIATYPDELAFWNLDNFTNTATSGGATIATYLLSPSQISGSASHLSSVQFCYGTATSRAPSSSTSMTITGATVVEFTAGSARPTRPDRFAVDRRGPAVM